jgi:hypothetical protein
VFRREGIEILCLFLHLLTRSIIVVPNAPQYVMWMGKTMDRINFGLLFQKSAKQSFNFDDIPNPSR